MTTYEAMLIFKDNLEDDVVDAALKRVQEEVERVGGKAENPLRMGKRNFARVMQKQTAGTYFLMNVEMDGTRIADLKARLKFVEELMRAQFVVPVKRKVAVEAATDEVVAEKED